MPSIEDNMHTWDNDQIRDYYDQNPNLTILTYAGMLGLTGGELKDILMAEEEAPVKVIQKMAGDFAFDIGWLWHS